ncbi:1-acylglycerol-3-phosphate O-acyltransferase [Bacterioplanoides sp. SCSIO 12839]|uniref:1-acylglycerol-3-phosphate O-acyltransferase n=1 Tax=Bacterioplanoides sp. SCSIO 12839 TaxID=2829569 RepID=UPI0021042852|nr:1-acylglycerol-3-phosphate O-acyltransferase [Bacterioplanoides sp. SCSIO 12839]UTW48454.1 1-acylglycerol-3-phosphate O-acyltransferase [Bacterioplanoides sp. SCSIO 12839]
MLFYLRVLLLTAYFLIACGAVVILCLVRPFHRKNNQQGSWILSLGRYLLGLRFKVVRRNPLSDDQQAIYISNHQDSLDVFTVTAQVPANTAYLGKSTLKYIPVFGTAFWLAGNLFINRKNKAKAWETMGLVAKQVKEKKCSVYIFPEGTRSRGRGLMPFKSGAFALAIESGLPIVPVVFSSSDKNIDPGRLKSGTCLVKYLDPISTEGMGEEDVRALADHCHTLVQNTIDELDAEIAAMAPMKQPTAEVG